MSALRTAAVLLLTLIAAAGQAAPRDALTLYAPPAGKAFWSSANDDFTVRVRTPGGEWRDLYEYKVRVNNDRPTEASMVFFDTDGPVEVSVKKNNGDVRRVAVRPASAGIVPTLAGDTATFRLTGPAKLSVEFDGDRLANLHLFAGRAPAPPAPGPGVTVYGPGIHTPPGGADNFRIGSGQTVYLDGGAILEGGLDISGARGVRILGHGLVRGAKDNAILVANARDVVIDGPTIVNPGHYSIACGQSQGITIRDVKAFSQGSWTDGIDMMSCSDVRIDDVFLRNSDDTIAVYGGRWSYKGDARNYLVTRAILWADVAHPINIGLHGSPGGDTIANLVFRDIDILEHDEDDPDYQGALAITDGDNNLVRDVTFDDIRIDRIEEGSPFSFRVIFIPKYSHDPGRGIRNVVLRNVAIRDPGTKRATIAGFAADRGVESVRFEAVTIGGRPLLRSDIDIGGAAKGIALAP